MFDATMTFPVPAFFQQEIATLLTNPRDVQRQILLSYCYYFYVTAALARNMRRV